mgnify:CR=1 FL=1
MIVLDYRDSRPLHEQVAERLRELMFKGALPQDAQLPSVRSLATELSINPNTIQRAYTELERQGYIYSIKGKGSFVADNSRMKAGIVQEWKGHFKAAVEEGIKVPVLLWACNTWLLLLLSYIFLRQSGLLLFCHCPLLLLTACRPRYWRMRKGYGLFCVRPKSRI